jgi:hypothetical protein
MLMRKNRVEPSAYGVVFQKTNSVGIFDSFTKNK